MKQNKLIYFANVIYALEKDYGFHTDLYRPTETLNLETGKKTVSRIKYRMQKAIWFPNQLFRDYNYAALFGKDMQFGGILDVNQRRVLINKKRLPRNFKIQSTDYVVFNHSRYEIQKFDELEVADYWHLVVKKIEGQTVNEVHELRVKQKINFIDSIVQEL